MNRISWRWQERDFGFRFLYGKGKSRAEYYQAGNPREFYIIPKSQRKLPRKRITELAKVFRKPRTPRLVPIPWSNYERDWDWIVSDDGICLNWAGCLDQHEIDRREDEGVQRAMEMIETLVMREEPVPLTVHLIQQIHVELMGTIYPFAGEWRTVDLHKGGGPTKWPLPPGGIQPLMDIFERDVLSRSPVISSEDQEIFTFASEVMNELLAIHPFREGNGRMAFGLADLILMQNNMLPLTCYDQSDRERYFAACEVGRIHKNYEPLATLLEEWEDNAIEQWTDRHG